MRIKNTVINPKFVRVARGNFGDPNIRYTEQYINSTLSKGEVDEDFVNTFPSVELKMTDGTTEYFWIETNEEVENILAELNK